MSPLICLIMSTVLANKICLNQKYVCDVKISRLLHELRTSVNGRVISLFREGFIFAKHRNREVSRK